jgi:hypothetical protein
MDQVRGMVRMKVGEKNFFDFFRPHAQAGDPAQGSGTHVKQDGVIVNEDGQRG